MHQRSRFTLFCLAAAAVMALLPLGAEAQVNFTAQLFGQAEVPPVDSDAYGNCVGILSEDGAEFTISCEHTLDAPTAAHIHTGFADESGPIVFPFVDPSSPIQATFEFDTDDVIRLLAGGFYVNVHTGDHPAGEIRGQLLPVQPGEGRALFFALRGDNEVPPVVTDTSGACFIVADFEEAGILLPEEVVLDIRCTHDVEDATDAELFIGAPGEEGTFFEDLGDPSSPIETTVTLTDPDAIDAFLSGELFVNILSTTNAEGELRGQVGGCLSSPTTLCLQGNRFAVTMDFDSEFEDGQAVGQRETIDSGLFWFFRPSNIEALVKVLDGCDVNDHYWVFLAAATDVGFDLTVTDTLSGEFKTYSNEQGNDAEPRLDTAAFMTCP
jgi:hypothetical protein